MLMAAVEMYLAVRRAAGFQLTPVESYLRSFARFAMERGQTYVVTHTVIAWATTAASEAQRHTRLMAVRRFAHFMHAEDPGMNSRLTTSSMVGVSDPYLISLPQKKSSV